MILNSPYISGSLTVTGNIIASGSITLSGSVASASYAASATSASYALNTTTASYAVSATTASYANALTVAGTLTAQTLVVQTITSSVDFVTGSTRFGSISGNTHVFTGSMSVSGSGVFSSSLYAALGNGPSLTLRSNSTSSYTYINIGRTSTDMAIGVAGTSGHFFVGSVSGDTWIGSINGTIGFGNETSGTSTMIVKGGNLGIGTTSPESKLHVVGNINASTLTLSTTTADYAATISNVQDSSQGLLVRASDNDTTLNILNLQSSVGATSQTWVDRFTVTKGGNVGIGTTTPVTLVELSAGSPKITFTATAYSGAYRTVLGTRSGAEGVLQLGNNSDNFIVGGNSVAGGNLKFYVNATSDFVTSTNGTFAMIISSAGRVGIGVTNPQAPLHIGSSSTGEVLRLASKDLAGDNWVGFYKSDGTRQGYIGYGYSASDIMEMFQEANEAMIFSTNATERVRLLSNGEIDLKSYGPNTNLRFNIQGGDTFNTKNGGSGTPMYLNYSGNGAIYAGVGAAVTLYAGSDERIKENINVVESTLDKVLQLIPKTFNYKETRNNNLYYGFVAQDVETIFPELVKIAEGISMCNDEEIVDQKSIESFGLVWASILTKAIQELKAQNDDLQSQINELKAQ